MLFAVATTTLADFNLRSKKINKPSGSGEFSKADTRIVVRGLVNKASSEDFDIIRKSIVNAYNEAYQESGYSIEGYNIQLTATDIETVGFNYDCRFCPPDDDAAAVKDTAQLILASVDVGYDCRFCPPDDDSQVQTANPFNLATMHRAFETAFCEDLRASGSPNMAKVRDCSFSFLDMPGAYDRNIPIQHQMKNNKMVKSEVQVLIHGAIHELSADDMAIVDTAITEAYNEAYASTGYAIKSYGTDAGLLVPTMTGAEAHLLIGSVGTIGWSYDCRFCPPDDDATAFLTKASKTQLSFLHQAFEQAICDKLQKSGVLNLDKAHDCSFRFVHNALTTEVSVEKE